MPAAREAIALALSLAGAGYSVAARALPGLPPVWPILASLVDSSPRLRGLIERPLGRPATDALFAMGNATGQALAQRPMALLTEAGFRALLHRELTARRQAWQQWEQAVAGQAGSHEAAAIRGQPRPVPLPSGPIEKLSDVMASAALAGFGIVMAVSRNSERATATLTAGIPRAARVGREAFTSQLDTFFSRAGSLVTEPEALRRLDRVDTVVLDHASLLTGRYVVDTVTRLDDALDQAELTQRVHELLDARHPRARRERDGWTISPVGDPPPEGIAARVAELAAPDALLLVVFRADEPVGIVRVVRETDPMAEALVEAAHQAGTVLLGDAGSSTPEHLPVDGTVAGGHRLAGEVRRLQAEGHVVAVVSARHRDALAAADVGLGLPGAGGALPWGAHVLCRDTGHACLLLSAVPQARQTTTDVARLSAASSALGVLLGGIGPATGAAARAAMPINLGAALGIGIGLWRGVTATTRQPPLPVDRTPWHEMSPRAVLTLLSSSAAGLTDTESARRHGRTGVADEDTDAGLVRASADELANPLTPTLAAGAGISAGLGSIADAALIIGVLALNGLIGGAQRVGAHRELRRLLNISTLPVRVRRTGTTRDARSVDLVPGDVIQLDAGDAVPADCRLLEAAGLEVDESSLTGESQLVTKDVRALTADDLADRTSMIYQGTVVAAGHALAVVVATGDHTEAGRSARTNGEAPRTGVDERLRTLAGRTLPLAVGAGAVLMGMAVFRGLGIGRSLGSAVSLAVAAVPEGLPFVATVAELASARRLSQRGVLVRSAHTIEALGRIDVLCFDKTGTLTEGRIALRQVSDGARDDEITALTAATRSVLAAAVRASPWQHDDHPGSPAVPHPTDRAVLDGARAAGVGAADEAGELTVIAEIAFEPARGYHATLARHTGGFLLSVKGAPEVLLERCARWRRGAADLPFDAAARDRVRARIELLAGRGYRVLAVAERDMPEQHDLDDDHIRELDFHGLIALADPVRPTAAAAVAQLRRAGVDVVMVTGDHPSTATAIAAELGMADGRGVLTGAQLEALDDPRLDAALPRTVVFARVSPAQKAHLVRVLRARGKVVAMTGDGANDAPAIRLAHVGIALGSRATPAARETADLVVTDDRIETITDALLEGRAMWASVRDAVGILLGGNLGEIAFTLVTGLFGAGETLNARQLLLVNLLTDVLPAMAVAVRPPPHVTADQLLAEGPEASLGGALLRDVYRRAAVTAGSTAAGWLLARPVSTPAQASTTALVALVGGQLAQTIAVRGRTPLVVGAGVVSLVILVAVVQTPGLSQFFGCRPLLPHQWGIGAAASAAGALAELIWQLRSRAAA